MPTIDNYECVDGRWALKTGASRSEGTINQTTHPIVRVDEKSYTGSTKPLEILTARQVIELGEGGTQPLWGSFLHEESVLLLSGEAGVGKTTFAYNMAVYGARGAEFCGIAFSRPLNTIYCDLETGDGLRGRKLSLISDNEPPENLYFLRALKFNEHLAELIGQVNEKEIDLVIVDTINEAFDTKDEQDNAEANKQFALVRRLRDETGCTILLMHHIGKGEQNRKVYRARGASARAATVDVVLNLVAKTEDTICLEKDKDRIAGGKEKLYLRKAGEDSFEVIEEGEDLEMPLVVRAQSFLVDAISKGISHRRDLNEQGKQYGYSEATVGRALDNLVRAGELDRVKKGVYALGSKLSGDDLRVVGLDSVLPPGINHQI